MYMQYHYVPVHNIVWPKLNKLNHVQPCVESFAQDDFRNIIMKLDVAMRLV